MKDELARILTRDSNPGIPNPGIPGSRTIFLIPNPGIGDVLIPGFLDYEKETKCPHFTYDICQKMAFSRILGPNSRL